LVRGHVVHVGPVHIDEALYSIHQTLLCGVDEVVPTLGHQGIKQFLLTTSPRHRGTTC
jgi:hypothetical protein